MGDEKDDQTDLITTSISPLLPDRQEQGDFFICDVFAATPKADMASMEHPVFSLSTKPDRRIREYTSAQGKNFIKIRPSSEGLATVHDRDILIFCISQLISALNAEQPVSKTLRFKAYDLLKATNRDRGGKGYKALRAALLRLQGTQIETNIETGGVTELKIFSLVDEATVVRDTHEGRMQEIEIKLSDWVFNAIHAREVLTYNKDYFRLRSSIERRIYEIGRKHCGRNREWRVSLAVLQSKCGSLSPAREFRRMVGKIVQRDIEHRHMPDYRIFLDGDFFVFVNAGSIAPIEDTSKIDAILISTEAREQAKREAPGYDIYFLEQQWRNWMVSKTVTLPKSADKAFIGFCKKFFEKNGRP